MSRSIGSIYLDYHARRERAGWCEPKLETKGIRERSLRELGDAAISYLFLHPYGHSDAEIDALCDVISAVQFRLKE